MEHDELFKAFLNEFMQPFLELFFPAEAALLDFSTLTFPGTEFFTDFPGGDVRRADVVAEVRTRTGDLEVILIHVEVQAVRESDVPFRMWQYYHLIRLRSGAKVFPIVLYLAPGAGGIVAEVYRETVLGRETVRFTYAAIGLPDLDGMEYVASTNPAAIGLSALMRFPKSNKAERKMERIARVAETTDANAAQQHLLAILVDRYLFLDLTEQMEFEFLKSAEETEMPVELMTSWEEKGIARGMAKGLKQGLEQGIAKGVEQGIAEGLEQGLLRGQRETLLMLMQAKFGTVPDTVQAAIMTMDSRETLAALAKRVLTAATVDEMEVPIV